LRETEIRLPLHARTPFACAALSTTRSARQIRRIFDPSDDGRDPPYEANSTLGTRAFGDVRLSGDPARQAGLLARFEISRLPG
jgi:hypothetical protein